MEKRTKQYFRIVRKGDETFVLDEDSKMLPADKAKQIAQDILDTVDQPIYVYVGYHRKSNLFKIGMSKNPEQRRRTLGIKLYHVIKCDRFGEYSAANVETQLHDFFGVMGKHVEGEWFQLQQYDLQVLKLMKTGKDATYYFDWIVREIREHYRAFMYPLSDAQISTLMEQIKYTDYVSYVAGVYTLHHAIHTYIQVGNSERAEKLKQFAKHLNAENETERETKSQPTHGIVSPK